MPTHRSPELPAPIASFFTHESSDPHAVSLCFTEDAVVADEGRRHVGRVAIAAWNAGAVSKYGITSEPLAIDTVGARSTVTTRVRGTFPGSPIQLRFVFTVADDRVSRLEIAP